MLQFNRVLTYVALYDVNMCKTVRHVTDRGFSDECYIRQQ